MRDIQLFNGSLHILAKSLVYRTKRFPFHVIHLSMAEGDFNVLLWLVFSAFFLFKYPPLSCDKQGHLVVSIQKRTWLSHPSLQNTFLKLQSPWHWVLLFIYFHHQHIEPIINFEYFSYTFNIIPSRCLCQLPLRISVYSRLRKRELASNKS